MLQKEIMYFEKKNILLSDYLLFGQRAFIS